jgi:hypothetical protein
LKLRSIAKKTPIRTAVGKYALVVTVGRVQRKRISTAVGMAPYGKSLVLLFLVWVPYCTGSLSPPFNSAWSRSNASKVNLTSNGSVWRWTKPVKSHSALTYLPTALDLSTPGKSAVIKLSLRSGGKNKCDPYDWQDNKTCSCKQDIKETCEPNKGTPKCAKTSVNCIEGTGDFRMGMWDTQQTPFPPDDWGGGFPNMENFRGYHWRFMPHVSPVYFHPKESEPGGFYAKVNSTNPFADHRISDKDNKHGVFAGFGVPHDTWVPMVLNVSRVDEMEYSISIEINGFKHNMSHVWGNKDEMPLSIGAFGFWFPNSRSYDYLELKSA